MQPELSGDQKFDPYGELRLLASLPPDAATLARISEESLRRAGFEGDGSDAPSDGY